MLKTPWLILSIQLIRLLPQTTKGKIQQSNLSRIKPVCLPTYVYKFRSFLNANTKYSTNLTNINKAYMLCLGFESGSAGWNAPTDPLSYGVRPFSTFFISKKLAQTNLSILPFGTKRRLRIIIISSIKTFNPFITASFLACQK